MKNSFKDLSHNFFNKINNYCKQHNLEYIIRHSRNFIKKLHSDNISGYASGATLFTMISSFPFALLFIIMIGYTPISTEFVINIIEDSLPAAFSNIISDIINEVFDSSTTIISISAIAALWSASKGFNSICMGFNKIYHTGETRNFIIIRLLSVVYTICFAVLLFLTLILLVFGNNIFKWLVSKIPIITDVAALIIGIRTTVLLFLLLVYFLIIYIVLPNRKSRLIYELPGAVISSFGWVTVSYLYSYYINNIGDFSAVYGSFSAIVFLMLWLYFCMYILFIGAEINVSFGQKLTKKIAAYKTAKASK